ncbi:MAG: phage integrase N-terminal SAM-like domain-containing protein [Chloroflexota bacterium]
MTKQNSSSPNQPKLLDRVRNLLRLKNYAYSTEKSYTHWIKRYILFHGSCR